MTAADGLLGVVLAGGGSRRFGRAKGDARLAGRTLIERAVRTLTPLCEAVVVGRAPDLPDLRPGCGPLGGVEAALTRAATRGAAGIVVLACDLPAVHTATLVRLVAAWRRSREPRRTVAVPDDPLQPLCGVWGVELAPSVTAALDAGRGSARDLVRDLQGAILVSADDLASDLGLLAAQLLHNVNRPDDLEPARGLLLPPVVSVIGWKNSGKTTVAVRLLEALVARGIDAVAAKHGHGFELDTEGTDSWRLRHETGTRRVLLAGPDEMALWDRRPAGGCASSLGGLVRRWLRDAELVVAEGWKEGPWPAIEARGEPSAAASRPPLYRSTAPDAPRFLAIVTPEHDGRSPRSLHRDDPDLGERLADLVESRILASRR